MGEHAGGAPAWGCSRRADQDAVRVDEVVDGGAFGEEFGVGEDFEGGVGAEGGELVRQLYSFVI